MALRVQQEQWKHLGRVDPLWAVLSDPAKRQGGWNAEEFFGTGRLEIRELMGALNALGYPRSRTAALDFGCGVGRLTLALAEWFDEVTGVDISPSMIEGARRFDQTGGRCRFLLNGDQDLRQLPSNSFDLVYSLITLQHIPERYARSYIREFVRVLRPQGIAIFQAPSRLQSQSRISRLGYQLRLFARRKILRDTLVFEMYGVPRETVERDLAQSGAKLLEIHPDHSAAPEWEGFRYFVTK